MSDWAWWLIAALVLGVGETASGGTFFLAPFAVGALVASVAAVVGLPGVVQLVFFLLISVGVFAFLRPIAKRHMSMPAQLRTGTAALVGKRADVLEPISRNGGSIRLENEVWSARPYDEDEVIEAGKQVHVMQIKGATALVSE
jgi:membrane protein implicated in regulation of membrane protease activity